MALYGKMASVTYQDYPEAKLIILWGVNPSASGIHIIPFVREAQKRGAKLIVIDPRTTTLARSADIHLAVKTGTDVAVALAIHRYLFANGHTDDAFLRAAHHRRGRAAGARRAVDVRTGGGGLRRRRGRARSGRRAVRRELAGADPMRLGAGAEPQRRQRRDVGAGAAGGRRQVRRARRRLLDEQLGVLEHRAHLDRCARAGHAHRQHESSRPRADRVRRPAGQRAVRLQLQSGGDRARSAAHPQRAGARGSVHRRLRAGHDRHGALRGRAAAEHHLPRGLRLRQRLRPDQPRPRTPGHRRGRRSAAECRRVRRAVRAARPAERRRAVWRARSDADRARPAAGDDRRAISATAPMPTPPCGPAPVQFVDVFPNTPDRKVNLFPAALDPSTPIGLYRYQPDPGNRAVSAGADLAVQRAHDQLDARRAAAPRRQAADASRGCAGARARGERRGADLQRPGRGALPADGRAVDPAGHRQPAEGDLAAQHAQQRHRHRARARHADRHRRAAPASTTLGSRSPRWPTRRHAVSRSAGLQGCPTRRTSRSALHRTDDSSS